MATRCSIGIKTKDNKFKAIYCHWDGYPEHTGQVLVEHYNDEEQIEKLFELGDLSFIDTTLDTCIAYHRDRGEKLHPARVFETEKEMCDHFSDCWCEYFYIFKNGKWYFIDDFGNFESDGIIDQLVSEHLKNYN